MANIVDELIVASPERRTTLTAHFGHILNILETDFGERDLNYTLLGIEFCADGPRTWFYNDRQLSIRLTLSAMSHPQQAVFQLAHEAVHLLDPSTLGRASVFEEGIATMFQLQYVKTIYPSYDSFDRRYNGAADRARHALGMTRTFVRDLRGQGTKLSEISTDQFLAACPNLARSEADILCTKFEVWNI
jgi:hypothetical protein